MSNVFTRFRDVVSAFANATAVVDATTEEQAPVSLTYAELDIAAGRVAAALAARGVSCGDRVAAIVANGIDFAVLYAACVRNGLCIVPINRSTPRAIAEFLINLAQPRLIVADPRWSSILPLDNRWTARAVDPASLRSEATHVEPLPWSTDPDGILSITFTSGTTGQPKGVAHDTDTILANARAFNDHVGIDKDTRLLHVMPMTYMAGFLNTLLSPWMAGASVVLAPPFDATTALRFWEPARAHDVNTLWLTPTIISALCRLDRDLTVRDWAQNTLRSVFAGTAPLPEAKSTEFQRRFGARPLESYGMTELLLVTGNRSGCTGRLGSVGRPLPDIETAFRRKSGSNGQEGNAGQLWIRTPYALKGYVEPDIRELVSPLTDGWLSTGDLGHRDDDGNLFITGREKDLIIRGGVNVSPLAIEGVLLHHADVVEAAVVGVPHDFWGEEVVACLELSRSKSVDDVRTSLIESCREQASLVPDRFVSANALPRGVSGKIQRNVLRERLITGKC